MNALAALREGGKTGVARALTAVERAPEAEGTVALLDAAWAEPRGVALGITGPPGVGKSTLAAALVPRLRAEGRTVAVLAVDPSSRRSGGALLGDRTRFATGGDAGLFIRSVAARDSLGGLAEVAFPALVLLRAVYDVTLVETVGVGQSEVEVAETADLTALCVQPGAGDAIQFMKAGVTEIPDLVLVTKADAGAAAERAAADLRSALALGASRSPPSVSLVSAREGRGLEAVMAAIEAERGEPAADRVRQAKAWAERTLHERFGAEGLAQAREAGVLVQLGETPFQRVKEIRERLRRALAGAMDREPTRI